MPSIQALMVDRVGTTTAITNVVDSFEFTYGSSNGYDQPQPSVLSLVLYGNSINGITVNPTDLIGQSIYLKIGRNAFATPYMTITSVRMEPIDSSADNNLLTISAVGGLYRMSKYLANRSVIASDAGTTWLANLALDSAVQWGDLNQAIQWNDYGDPILWNDYYWNGLDVNGSTVTGMNVIADTRTWQASTGIAENAYQYVQNACQVNDSWLSETAGGWATLVAPLSYYAGVLPSSQTIDCSTDVVFSGIETTSDASEKVNDVTVTNGTVTAYSADGNDIASWGDYAVTQTSTLDNILDLQNISDRILKSHASGTRTLSRITVDLDVSNLTLWLAPFLLTLTNLPTAYTDPAGTTMQVRGFSMRGNTYHTEADLVLVPKTVWDYGQTMWNQTTAAWNAYLTALSTWNDVP